MNGRVLFFIIVGLICDSPTRNWNRDKQGKTRKH